MKHYTSAPIVETKARIVASQLMDEKIPFLCERIKMKGSDALFEITVAIEYRGRLKAIIHESINKKDTAREYRM